MADSTWDPIKAYARAVEHLAVSGISADELIAATKDDQPVGKARRYADLAAPAMMRLQLAVVLGTSPEDLDRWRGGFRIMLDGIKTSLAIVGLRAGEEISVEPSDKLLRAMERWRTAGELPEGEAPIVLDHDPGEAARRR